MCKHRVDLVAENLFTVLLFSLDISIHTNYAFVCLYSRQVSSCSARRVWHSVIDVVRLLTSVADYYCSIRISLPYLNHGHIGECFKAQLVDLFDLPLQRSSCSYGADNENMF